MNIQGQISDFTHKAKSNFCRTYTVNLFEEQVKNRYIASISVPHMYKFSRDVIFADFVAGWPSANLSCSKIHNDQGWLNVL